MISPELLAALATHERRASATTFSASLAEGEGARRVAGAAEAVRAAVAHAGQGKRASVLLQPDELLAAVESIAAAARSRTPITVHVTGNPRRPSSGRDELAVALDLGAGVLVTWNAQDALDLSVGAHRAAEDSETPFLLLHDGADGAFAPADEAIVARFLGPARARGESPEDDHRRKRAERSFASRAPFALASALRELGEATGRPLAALERFETADAEEIVVAVGASFEVARHVARELRAAGRRAGALGVRALRPFFAADVVKAVARAKAVGVIEPLDIALAPAGPVASALKGAFADAITWAHGFPGIGHVPTITAAGFATFDESPREVDVLRVFDEIALRDRARRSLVFGSDLT